MSDQDNHCHSDPKNEVFLKIIQEKIASKLEELEKNSEAQDSCLYSLKTEIDGLTETGTVIAAEVEELAAKQHKVSEINLESNEESSVSPGKKVPLTTRETKTISLHDKTDTRRRKSIEGKSTVNGAGNDASEHKEQPVQKHEKKVGANGDTSKSVKTEKTPTANKKGPTDTKKSPTIKETKGKDEKEEEKKESGEHEANEGHEQEKEEKNEEGEQENHKKTSPKKNVPASKSTEKTTKKESKPDTKKSPTVKKEVEEEKKKEEDVTISDPNRTPEEAALEECRSSLKHLDFNKVAMVTSLSSPPQSVVKVFEAICIVLDQKATWANAQKVAKLKDFLKMLSELKPESLSEKSYKKVKHILSEDVTKLETIAKASMVAKHLCQWLHGFLKLYELNHQPHETHEQPQETHEANETQEVQENHEAKETHEVKESQEVKETHEEKEVQETKENQEGENNQHEEKVEHSENAEQKVEATVEHQEEKKESAEREDVKTVEDKHSALLPILREGENALKILTHSALVEMKSFTNPPVKVAKVMEVVCVLLGHKATNWAQINKTVLNDPILLDKLLKLNIEAIPDKTCKKAKAILDEAGLDLQSMKQLSAAAKAFSIWAFCVVKYRESLKGPEKHEEENSPKGKEGMKEASGSGKKTEPKKATETKTSPKQSTTAPKDDKKEDKDKDKAKDVKSTRQSVVKEEKKAPAKTETTKTEKAAPVEVPELKAILGSVSENGLAEIKSLAKPPTHVLTTFQLVSLLIQGKEFTWQEISKSYLASPAQLHKSLNIDLKAITKSNIEAVHKKIAKTKIEEAAVKNASAGAAAIFKWVMEAIKLAEQSKQATNKKEEQKAEEPKTENEDHHEDSNNNLKEILESLKEIIGSDVSHEIHDGDCKEYIKHKISHYHDLVKTLRDQNEHLRTSGGVAENVENKHFELKESVHELIKSSDKSLFTALLEKPEWDDKIYQILALFFLVKGESDVPSLDNKEGLKAYATERLKKGEEDPDCFLIKFEGHLHHLNLNVLKKIKIQEFIKEHSGVLDVHSFDGLDALCHIVAAVTKEVCEYLGVVPVEGVEDVHIKERVYLLNQEKIEFLENRHNTFIELAQKHNIHLD